MITLSKRLQALADLVRPCEVAADIGCDHGFLSVYLVQAHKAGHVIASDINAGPLARARENIRAGHLEDCIETIQCDGLQGIKADTIIIAGMGGRLMLKILTDGIDAVRRAHELILQPQSELKEFRYGLIDLGLKIDAEDFVIEDGKYYPMMRVLAGRMELSGTEALYGPLLLRDRHPALHEFLLQQNEYLQGLLQDLRKQDTERARSRLSEIEDDLKRNEEALLAFEDTDA